MSGKKIKCYYVKEKELRSAFCERKSLTVLRYKETLLSLIDLNYSLLSGVVSFLHDFKDIFPKKMPGKIVIIARDCIKLTSFPIQQFPTDQHKGVILSRQRNFKGKWRS